MSKPHEYTVIARDPAAHVFEVSVTVANPDQMGQAFRMPAWVPGSYMIRDLARHVISISAESAGREIALTKTDKSSWIADSCDAPLTVTARIYALDRNVRGAHLDTTHGFFDGASLFLAVAGQENVKCELTLLAPEGKIGSDWRVATSMKSLTAGRYEFGKYVAENYAELIDHPVEMGHMQIGEFEVNGVPHAIAVSGHTHFDMARICRDLTTLCTEQTKLLDMPSDLDRYLFLLTVMEDGYGGLEHAWSTALICSRKDLPRRGDTTVNEDYRKFLGLCSHEYFHLWNIKRITPSEFVPYELHSESYTKQLWVFEGVTSYYDDLFIHRAGLISADSYLDLLAKNITRLLRCQGRNVQSVEESSFDAWTKFYKQHSNSGNSIVSYYAKGALIALLLDLTIRKDTDGQCSLDDVMREFWARHASGGEGVPDYELESIARSVSGLELSDFFERYVRGTGELPLAGVLKAFGLVLHTRPATGRKDLGGKPAPASFVAAPWMGAKLLNRGGASRFGKIESGSPAEIAGLTPGDEAVAIDGLRLTAGNFDSRLRDYHSGDKVTLTVFRDQQLVSQRITLTEAPMDTCYLVVDEDAQTKARQLLDSWLQF